MNPHSIKFLGNLIYTNADLTPHLQCNNNSMMASYELFRLLYLYLLADKLNLQNRSMKIPRPPGNQMSSSSKSQKLKGKMHLLSQADGSCSLSVGQTAFMAAVYGPREVKMNKEKVDKAVIEFMYRPKVGQSGCAERFWETLVGNTCETAILCSLHPRKSVGIIVQELQNSGSQLACCINAAFLALLDACIPVRYMVAATCCVITEGSTEPILSPTAAQEENAIAHMTFAFDSVDNNVVCSHTTGCFSEDQFQLCLEVCRKANKQVFDFYREALRERLSGSMIEC